MRKIDKSPNVPAPLVGAPVPTSAAEVRESIYKADDVRRQLIYDQYYKCAYCECYLTLQYHDVEHYRPKSHYYWLGHKWTNLLYACERCNRSYKNDQFPLAEGSVQANSPIDNLDLEHPLIINPVNDDPARHIKFERYVAKGITPKGQKTIEIFHLNDQNERPELIDNRKQLYELYELEHKKIKMAKLILSIPEMPQIAKDTATQMIALSIQSINELKAPNKPFSGMLVAQL